VFQQELFDRYSCHLSPLPLRSGSCIYFGNLRRQTRFVAQLQGITHLISVPARDLISPDLSHLPTLPAMSFNITADGSPTPRKAMGRFPVPDDLRLDTSPEGLGLVVGSRYQQQHYPFHRGFNSSLTSNAQGTKRPLGSSTQVNQMMPQQSLDGFKVCQAAHSPPHIYLTLTSLEAQGRIEQLP